MIFLKNSRTILNRFHNVDPVLQGSIVCIVIIFISLIGGIITLSKFFAFIMLLSPIIGFFYGAREHIYDFFTKELE